VCLQSAKIVGPGTGYVFRITSNEASIEGSGEAKITVSTGGSGGVWNDQAMRTHYWNFKIDLNNIANAIGFYQDGGWYLNVKNVEIDKATTVATSDGVRIISTYTGVAGTTGSYSGSYVSTYENIVAKRVRITGDLTGATNKVTTMTFIDLDAANIIAANALALTFIRPVIQTTSSDALGVAEVMFDLTNVSGLTAVGGDFEAVGVNDHHTTIWKFTGGSNRGISSDNNTISYNSGAGAFVDYFSGTLPAASYFYDDDQGVAIPGQTKGYIGSAQPLFFQNSGFTSSHALGMHYDGDTFEIGCNLRATSSTQGNLADPAKAGYLLRMNTSGQFKLFSAAASATNPVTLSERVLFDALGAKIQGLPTYADEAAASGLGAGQLYKTAAGLLGIKL
jgi:hypothetical protein